MAIRIKQTLYRSPMVRYLYACARSPFDRREAGYLFSNASEYVRALRTKDSEPTVLHTHDGLDIAIRQNRFDAEIVREVYFRRPYTRHVRLRGQPVVIDIGGYIGDFTLFAVRYLGAARVIVCEPTAENFAVLQHNVALNGYGDRVTALDVAVGPPGELALYVDHATAGEVHASSHWYRDGERRAVTSVPLADLLDWQGLDRVDLLKIDCEGGEYAILGEAALETLARIDNVVFEYHEVDGYLERLQAILDRLAEAGFTVHRDGHIVSAVRR